MPIREFFDSYRNRNDEELFIGRDDAREINDNNRLELSGGGSGGGRATVATPIIVPSPPLPEPPIPVRTPLPILTIPDTPDVIEEEIKLGLPLLITTPPPMRRGCTDPTATNYDARARIDNGRCKYPRPIQKPKIRVLGGCTDVGAENYNERATFDNGTCRYEEITPTSIYNDANAPVKIRVSLNPSNIDGAIYVDGVDTKQSTKNNPILSFTEKELLTPKIIKVKKSSFNSRDTFRIRTVKKKFVKEIKPLFDFETTSFLQQNPPVISPNLDFSGLTNLDFTGIRESVANSVDFSRLGNINLREGQVIGIGDQSARVTFPKGSGLNRFAPPPPPRGVTQTFAPSLVKRKTRVVKSQAKVITNSYYETIVEKKIDGLWVQQNVQKPGDVTDINFLKKRFVNLSILFDLVAVKIDEIDEGDIEDPIIIDDQEPNVKSSFYTITLQGDLPNNQTIKYRTNYGQLAYLRDDDKLTSFKIERFDGQTEPFIEFFGEGISDYTHEVFVEYQSNQKNGSLTAVDSKFELEPGLNDFKIRVTKKPVSDSPSTPSISTRESSLKFNYSTNGSVSVNYNSSNAEYVKYTLGKTTRKLGTNGTITLTKSDFYNGLGRYTLYLQPVSTRGGSGESAKVIINVFSKQFVPGPDITTINYPQNIKGADFKGYNVNFNVSWQSINTNYVLIYAGKVSKSSLLGRFGGNGSTNFNVASILRKLRNNRKDILQIPLKLVPYNTEGNSTVSGKIESINITFDKGDLTLRRARVVSDIKEAFISQFDTSGFDDFISPFLSHYLHLGAGKNKLIGTWGIDRDTLSEFSVDEDSNRVRLIKEEKALVLKLYEPLPRDINTNDKVWLSKVQSLPLIDQITIIDDIVKDCTPLQPNFDLDIGDDVGYQILDDLITSGSTSSTEVVEQFVSSSEFSLDNLYINFVTQSSVINENGLVVLDGIDTYNWDEFVKYSSAEERVENFVYKVKLIQAYESKYELLTSGSAGSEWTGSLSVSNEANKQQVKIREVKRGFDSFEKFLFTSSSLNGLTYPGAGQNELSASSDSSVTSWYSTILNSSKEYDSNNTSKLTNNLPEHILLDTNNSEFLLFFDMIGQHFDILYTHINGLSRNKKLEHSHSSGINNDLIYHMLKSLGWDANMGVSSQFLWEYAFGKHTDGTVVSEVSGKDRQSELWRRILNNLPYLYKHKGTKRALHAALSCYGVPASALTIMEFSGPQDRTKEGSSTFTFDDRTASINISGSSSITIPWNQYSRTSDYPNSVEVRLNTEIKQDQEILSGSQWSLHLLKDTGSLAKVELRVMDGSTLVSSSTDTGSFFNDEYTQIVVNKETTNGNDVFTFYAKEGFQNRLRTNVSGSLTVSGVSGWTSGSEIKVGGNNLTASIDEFRLWTSPLSESKVDNHTLMPDAIDGNHVSASSEDLLFRLDFEYPKNRHSSGDTSIKNVSITRDYATFATASNFENITSYPYQYKSYERTVTAQVPQSGFSMANKVRLESQTKIADLSYRSRATKKAFDQAPLDSDQLGLFFSPIKEINMDILKSIGSFNIDDYIGDPSDEYRDDYKKLKDLRNYYFDRYTLDYNQYIQLVRYFDKSLFSTLESLVPARAKVSSGLLIQPHILERSKVAWKKTTSEKLDYVGGTQYRTSQEADNPQYLMVVSASEDSNLVGTNPQHLGIIETDGDLQLSADNLRYEGTILSNDETNLTGTITRNSGSTMGGFEISIDNTNLGTSIQGQFNSTTSHQTIGVEPDSISIAGFGLYGSGSHAIRTYYDKSSNIVQERVKVYLVKESYTENVPENIDSSDSSRGTQLVSQSKNRFKVSILPFTGSDGNESSVPSGDNIVSATPLNGYLPSHYRNTSDLTTGLENSFFNGSKQTASTTTDGGSPVQTFTTNPNTLKVSDSGRGSGEPILEVE